MGLRLLIFTPTGILERSDVSLSRTIRLCCCRSRTRNLHAQVYPQGVG
jgi:hypothetical protein